MTSQTSGGRRCFFSKVVFASPYIFIWCRQQGPTKEKERDAYGAPIDTARRLAKNWVAGSSYLPTLPPYTYPREFILIIKKKLSFAKRKHCNNGPPCRVKNRSKNISTLLLPLQKIQKRKCFIACIPSWYWKVNIYIIIRNVRRRNGMCKLCKLFFVAHILLS